MSTARTIWDDFDELVGEDPSLEDEPLTNGHDTIPPQPDEIGFSGERLLALLERPAPDPVEAGCPIPGHFSLLVAPSFTGKTSLALWQAISGASGVAPWPGARSRGPHRVLIYSIDEAPEQVARRVRGLAHFHPAGMLERFAERIVVIGPDRDVDPEVLERLRFDEQGLRTLLDWIERAEGQGRPFGEVYVDAYADMIPAGETENSNEEGTRIGGALERIAVRTGAAIVLLHHTGKPKNGDSGDLPDVRHLGRGASSLAAKARAVMSLEPVAGSPHLRRVRTVTNLSRTPRPAEFQVSSTESGDEELLFFRPFDPIAAYRPEDYLSAEPISSNALAWALAGKIPEKGKRPPGEANKLAARLRSAWLQSGLVEVVEGPRRAKMIRLAEECSECSD